MGVSFNDYRVTPTSHKPMFAIKTQSLSRSVGWNLEFGPCAVEIIFDTLYTDVKHCYLHIGGSSLIKLAGLHSLTHRLLSQFPYMQHKANRKPRLLIKITSLQSITIFQRRMVLKANSVKPPIIFSFVTSCDHCEEQFLQQLQNLAPFGRYRSLNVATFESICKSVMS